MSDTLNKNCKDDMTTITIQKGEEYQSKQGSIYQSYNIFYENYCNAAKNLEYILTNSHRALKAFRGKTVVDSGDLLGYPNNIIAFCADRGHGKTSAMITFSGALNSLHDNHTKGAEESDNPGSFWKKAAQNACTQEQVQETYFKVLKYVDPTMIEEGDSILRVLLVRMFTDFQRWWEENDSGTRFYLNNRDEDCRKRDELIDLFQKALHAVKLLLSHKAFDDSGDELEQIIDQCDISGLRGVLYRLICCYLEIMVPNKNSVLVIQIDDVDLNTGKAYRIMEDIRRYLFMPRLVILMAMNLEQMESTVEQHFLEEFQISTKNGGMVNTEECHDMAERYLDKTLPGPRQIRLKNIDAQLRESFTKLQVKYHEDGKELLDTQIQKNDGTITDLSYQEQLLRLLHQKTGMILFAPKYLHNLLPHTMRELTHFLAYFQPMENIDTDDYRLMVDEEKSEERKKWLKNIQRFRDYFLNIWASVNLREEEKIFLRKLSREGDGLKNIQVLKFLPEYYGRLMASGGMARGVSTLTPESHRDNYLSRCAAHDIWIDKLDVRESAAYADVNEALNILMEMPGGSAFYRFIYAIRFYYSIRLHELMLSEDSLKERWESMQHLLRHTLFNPKRVHIEVESGSVNTPFKVSKDSVLGSKSNEIINTVLRAWCKKSFFIAQTSSYQYEPIRRPDDIENVELVFDPFYPLQSIFTDWREKSEDASQRQGAFGNHNVQSEEKRQEKANALIIILNWDVQYFIQRNFNEQRKGSLRDCLDALNQELVKKIKENEYIPLCQKLKGPIIDAKAEGCKEVFAYIETIHNPEECSKQLIDDLNSAYRGKTSLDSQVGKATKHLFLWLPVDRNFLQQAREIIRNHNKKDVTALTNTWNELEPEKRLQEILNWWEGKSDSVGSEESSSAGSEEEPASEVRD